MSTNEDTLTMIAGQPKTAKSAIIQKLSKQWPISTKALANCLQKEFALNVTYQAVHKALNQLEDEKVIERKEKGYQLHEDWISRITQISQNISQNYSRNLPLDFEKEIIQLYFPSWLAVGRFGAFTFKNDCPNPEGKPIVTCWMHVWPVSTVSAEESKQLLLQANRGYDLYCVSTHNTPLDKLFADWIGKMRRKNILGAAIPLDHDYVIVGDHIAQIYYDKEFRTKIDLFYKKNKDIGNIDYQKLQEIATEKTNVHVTVIKNTILAEKLRNEAISFFKKKKDGFGNGFK